MGATPRLGHPSAPSPPPPPQHHRPASPRLTPSPPRLVVAEDLADVYLGISGIQRCFVWHIYVFLLPLFPLSSSASHLPEPTRDANSRGWLTLLPQRSVNSLSYLRSSTGCPVSYRTVRLVACRLICRVQGHGSARRLKSMEDGKCGARGPSQLLPCVY